MEGRSISQSQEEEHARHMLLIPGKVLRRHEGFCQFLHGNNAADFVVYIIGIQHRGIAVGQVQIHGAAVGFFHIGSDVPEEKLVRWREKYRRAKEILSE